MTEKTKPIYYADVSRESKTAVSYIWRSARAIDGCSKQNERIGLGGGHDSLLSWNLEHINDAAFQATLALVEVFDDEDLERLENDVKEYASKLRRARVARRLRDTTGRTPEEAAVFAAKAAELAP